MRNIAFVPKRDVFQTDDRICANRPRHSADSFRQNRIAFVRHSRRTFLSGFEFFLRFADFRALPMPNLQREFFQRRRDYSQRRKIFGVTVALNDLRRNRREADSEFRANSLFNVRVEMRECPDRARNFADRNRFFSLFKPFFVPFHFGEPERESHSETRRFGVYAVRAPDLRRVFKFVSAAFQNLQKLDNFL